MGADGPRASRDWLKQRRSTNLKLDPVQLRPSFPSLLQASGIAFAVALSIAACSDSPTEPAPIAPLVGGAGGAAGGTIGGAPGGGVATGGTPVVAGGGTPSGGAQTGGTTGGGGQGGAFGGVSGSGGSSGGAPSGGSPSGGGGAAATGGSGGSGTAGGGGMGFYLMENLNRGIVAVPSGNGIFVSFRMLGYEYDAQNPDNVAYELYRDGTLLTTLTDSTNYLDMGGSGQSSYSVRPVIGGVQGAISESVTPWSSSYLSIPLESPGNGYTANDGSAADLDGDGSYEIILKWDPSNAKDNSQSGVTSDVYLDALKLDGTRLWRINLGPNIRAGAHYTQFIVFDFDGDGKAEMACKTAPGTRDSSGEYLKLGPAQNDDDGQVYRNSDGYVLSGPEYLTVFDGLTGAELGTVDFDVPRGSVSAWGDDYGNRVDRFLATAAYLDDTGLASFVMARGYYTRTTLTAWNFRNGQLSQLWKFDSNDTPRDSQNRAYTGQGSHSLSVANVDDDPGQEILYGAMAVDNDGKGLCSTGYNHGDALHVGDFIPSRAGLEVFMCNEDGRHPAYHIRDARTCENLQSGPTNGNDTGRCVADDIRAESEGAEMWAADVTGLFSATNNQNLGSIPGSQNFLIWWDGDETRELEDGTSISKYGMSDALLSCSQCASNNGTKSTPTLVADLLGDWREEVVWRESNNSALRVYTTSDVTQRRIYTLMHDPMYRVAISWQNVAYNQPPHPSFHIGSGMVAPPVPDIRTE